MSGGSWDYAYSQIAEIGRRLARERDPLRRAMGARVLLLSDAMHAIEWVDSGDYAPGDEAEKIRAFLAPGDELAQLRADLRELVARAETILGKA